MPPLQARGSGRQAPVRKSIPAPRPLSPRAQRFVAQVYAQEAERQRTLQRGVTIGKAAAKTDDRVAVYDQAGNLVGVVDPEAITRLAPLPGPEPKQNPATQQQAPAAAADGSVPTAKAMSRGAERSGQHQLGGPNPRGGVPVVEAEDAVTKALRKAVSAAPVMKARLQPGSSATAAERIEATDLLNTAALAALSATLSRPPTGR